jgi:hypothetical protein
MIGSSRPKVCIAIRPLYGNSIDQSSMTALRRRILKSIGQVRGHCGHLTDARDSFQFATSFAITVP